MSEEAPALRIPVTLDTGPAKQQLKELQGATDASVKATVRAQQQGAQQAARAVKQATVDSAKAEKDAAQQRQRLAKETNALLGQLSRDQAGAEKEAAAAQVQAARQAARDKARASQESFAKWKEAQDAQHRQAMQSWGEQQAAQERGKKSILGQITSVEALGQAFMRLQVVNQIAGVIRQAMQVAGEAIREARDYAKGLTDEMERARTGAKELAALRGQPATAGFTASMAREAAAAGVDVEKYQQFSTGYEAYAGQYVGEEGATPEQLAAQGKKISKEQSLELQKKVAGYSMGARGLGAEDSAQLLGLVIAKSQAGASNDEIMSNYAKMMKTAELAPGRTSPLLGQITELGMENVGEAGDMKSVLQAAAMARIMAQRNPQEASTYGRAMMRELREIRMDPKKSAELGLEKGMDLDQQLLQIDKKVQEHVAAGGDQGEFLSKYFKDARGWGGVQTYINEGIRGGGNRRIAAETAGVNAQTAEAETQKYRKGQEGRAATDRAEEIAVARERSARFVELRHIQSEARKAIVGSGSMEIPESMTGSFLTREGSMFGEGSRFEQEERAESGRIIRERLMGSHEGRQWLIQHHTGASLDARFHPPQNESEERGLAGRAGGIFNRSTSEDLLAQAANLLKRIAENQEKQEQRPLAAPPPMPGGGRRM